MSNAILTTYCYTCGEVSCLRTQVREGDLSSCAHLIHQTHWELIPLRTRFLGIFSNRSNLSCVCASFRWDNSSIYWCCFQLYWAVSLNTHIDIVDVYCIEDAVIHQLIYTCTSRYWYEQWQGQLSRAIYRYHSSNPYNRICVVGECEVDMATQLFHSIKLHVKPCCLTSLNLSASGPIEGYQILTLARVSDSVVDIQTKVDWLIGNDLQEYIFSIYLVISALEALELFDQVAQDIWSQCTNLKTSRNRQSYLSTSSILAVRYHTDGHMCGLVALVSQVEA